MPPWQKLLLCFLFICFSFFHLWQVSTTCALHFPNQCSTPIVFSSISSLFSYLANCIFLNSSHFFTHLCDMFVCVVRMRQNVLFSKRYKNPEQGQKQFSPFLSFTFIPIFHFTTASWKNERWLHYYDFMLCYCLLDAAIWILRLISFAFLTQPFLTPHPAQTRIPVKNQWVEILIIVVNV